MPIAYHLQLKPLGLAYILEIVPIEFLTFFLGHPVTDDILVAHFALSSLIAGRSGPSDRDSRHSFDAKKIGDLSTSLVALFKRSTVNRSHIRAAWNTVRFRRVRKRRVSRETVDRTSSDSPSRVDCREAAASSGWIPRSCRISFN